MRAVVVPEPGGVEALQVVDVEAPEPGPGEVLVRVTAAGVNRADLMQRQGFYDPPEGATPVLGLECSGDVVALGEGVTEFSKGEHVVALLSGGGYAEYVAVPAGQVAVAPRGVDLVDAAGLMEVAATVWSNVFMMAKLQHGETLLVHGGASGIGTMAIQLAKAFGARVVVTVGSAEKAAFCRELGADLAINYRETDFVDALDEAGLKADVILDIVGAKYLDQNVRALNTAGRLVVIGLQGGVKGELNLNRLLMKRAAVMATSLRARPTQEKAAIVSAMVAQVWPLVADGTVRPIVHARMPLDQVRDAHQVLEDSSHTGKVLLTL
ncbi:MULTISPECIES: NAD(P)H-quinone oxidoreductase [unclassified Aeromicrobium]|uniref:NAD(P)H-quinone oxidoreductase n=1 Tax=unclassified Aeromicrobium TaxID=2633570 RepID=UPI0006FDF868|nr:MULTISPECIES: NAD(P)H-quinone oxidoreductase [unclassified Aeromicrobium]KQO39522.1 NADPH:quinone oxidoreductase [Aeromicrobium sp. Leaf245]KQP26867.1 NADPH:quinone oxidoreductase [Aeromicrobium sp. Leaf272]KQP77983.1 NADPH:quinone oxidoreductase [Aeromicrobium sp. Leaf289]